jgi:xylulokinase
MDLNFHAEPGCWTASQSLGGLGAALDWWLEVACPDEGGGPAAREARYAALEAELDGAPEREDGPVFLPVAGGHDSPAGEARGGFAGVRLDHRRADLSRAVLEGAAFELRWALEEARAAGLSVDRLWMMGGATRSARWPRLVADAVGLPLVVSSYTHWPCLGAAMLAASGMGLRRGFEDGVAQAGRLAEALMPRSSPARERRYARYRQAVMARSAG